MQCSRCQADNKDDRRFCSSCGAPLVVHCPSCNFTNDAGSVFCGGCGTPLAKPKGSAHAAPSAVPPAYASPKAYTPAHLADRIIGGGVGSSVTVVGSGSVVLTNSSTYTGNWHVSGGTLRVTVSNALGTDAGLIGAAATVVLRKHPEQFRGPSAEVEGGED